jgi:hypothetical protein
MTPFLRAAMARAETERLERLDAMARVDEWTLGLNDWQTAALLLREQGMRTGLIAKTVGRSARNVRKFLASRGLTAARQEPEVACD